MVQQPNDITHNVLKNAQHEIPVVYRVIKKKIEVKNNKKNIWKFTREHGIDEIYYFISGWKREFDIAAIIDDTQLLFSWLLFFYFLF